MAHRLLERIQYASALVAANDYVIYTPAHTTASTGKRKTQRGPKPRSDRHPDSDTRTRARRRRRTRRVCRLPCIPITRLV